MRLNAVEVEEKIWIQEDVRVHARAKLIPPLFIGRRSRIGAGAQVGPYTVLGKGCQVGRGARVSGSILWDEVRVEENVDLKDLLLSRGFRISLTPISISERRS